MFVLTVVPGAAGAEIEQKHITFRNNNQQYDDDDAKPVILSPADSTGLTPGWDGQRKEGFITK